MQCWSQNFYSKCALLAFNHAAKTTSLLTNGCCCTMMFAYCSDVHCKHGDQQNQPIKYLIGNLFNNYPQYPVLRITKA